MKTLVERIEGMSHPNGRTIYEDGRARGYDDAIDNIRPIAAQHDTVMAQMAEALRLYDAEFDRLYSESRGKGLYNCDGQRLDNKLTNVAEKSGVDALAAYDKLGESA